AFRVRHLEVIRLVALLDRLDGVVHGDVDQRHIEHALRARTCSRDGIHRDRIPVGDSISLHERREAQRRARDHTCQLWQFEHRSSPDLGVVGCGYGRTYATIAERAFTSAIARAVAALAQRCTGFWKSSGGRATCWVQTR